MSNNITVTVELCASDRDRLDKIYAALERIGAPQCDKCVESIAHTLERVVDTAQEPAGAPAVEEKAETHATIPAQEEKPAEAPVAPQEKAKPTVTLSDIQQKVVSLSAQGAAMKKAVREVVTAYAERVSALTPEQYAEVFEKLTALEG